MTGASRHSIVLDLSAVPGRPAGVGRYGIELVRALRGLVEDERYSSLALVNSGANWMVLRRELGGIDVAAQAPRNVALRLLWEQAVLASRLRRADVSVVHGLHYTMPSRFGGARIVTVHDLTMVDNPQWHESTKVIYFTHALRRASRGADAIVVPSMATADRLEALFSPRCRVVVIPHGISRPSVEVTASSERDDNHLLFVGTIEPRKGIEDLVAAFNRLASVRPELHLTLVGQLGWKYASALEAIECSPFRSRIDLRGYVDDRELAQLFSTCSIFVYPSLAEGFGLPVLEAMAYGAPVITTRDSAMAEVSEGVATLVPPHAGSELADALACELDHPHDQTDRVRRGIEVARCYSWDRSARSHLELYRSLT